MNTFQLYFEDFVNKILNATKEKTLFIFKGLLPEQMAFLVSHENSIFKHEGLVVDGYFQPEELNNKKRNLVANLTIADGTLLGFYEELVALCSIVNDPQKLYDGKIVIVNNNLFQEWMPSPIPYEAALNYYDCIQNDYKNLNDAMEALLEFYGDVLVVDEKKALISHKNVHTDLDIEIMDLFTGDYAGQKDAFGNEVIIGTKEDWIYRLDLMEQGGYPVNLISDREDSSLRYVGLKQALGCLGVQFCDLKIDQKASDMEYDANQFLPLLQKYWGKKAVFRDLLFYEEPSESKATIEVSQGSLVSEIIDQCEAAMEEDIAHRDIFITAPTGAGKSLIFQLPAIYLAEKYHMVTFVISPLIALMNDQVAQLESERGVKIATCLNSTISFEERQARIDQIRNGQKSIVYLAPELLLATGLDALLGDRPLGLLVIDEAHTVTTWGRDFRADYWYLGDFIKAAKRNGKKFPVLCLTATAVYSGPDDVVNDTIAELELENPILHLGNVKRENIKFDIQKREKEDEFTSVEITKRELIIEKLLEYTAKKEKTLVYCPFKSQVEAIFMDLPLNATKKIRRYHAGVPTAERKLTEDDYRAGRITGLICTKAFGMGIDVKDIKHIIHFAPTGTLADYVQEIGRAAREKTMTGVAHMDYFKSDIRYVRSLNGISEMKQFQLQAMLWKLYEIYKSKKNRNMLVAPDSFSHLFTDHEIENKTKNGLLLLAKDLKYKYGGFPVLIVKPKAMLSKNYVSVPPDLEKEFLAKYGEFAQEYGKMPERIIPRENDAYASDIKVLSLGKVYSVRMGDLWEKHFPELTFGSFKYKFFNREILQNKNNSHISPRVKVTVTYKKDFDEVKNYIISLLDAIQIVLDQHKHGEKKTFDEKTFRAEINSNLVDYALTPVQASLLLDILTLEVDENAQYSTSRNMIKVLQRRKQRSIDATEYIIISNYYSSLKRYVQKLLTQVYPNGKMQYTSFVPIIRQRPIELLPLFKLFEILELASYEISGGEKAEIFVRINDPEKIRRLANGRYSNEILREIRRRHKSSQELLDSFFSAELSNDEIWECIEDYFLGNIDEMHRVLGKEIF